MNAFEFGSELWNVPTNKYNLKWINKIKNETNIPIRKLREINYFTTMVLYDIKHCILKNNCLIYGFFKFYAIPFIENKNNIFKRKYGNNPIEIIYSMKNNSAIKVGY